MKEVFLRNKTMNLDPLDGLRAISILLVILFHAFFFLQYTFKELQDFALFSASLPWYLTWLKRGDLGVDIFFVLSAFLIGSQLFKQHQQQGRIQFPKFYRKRLLRIYPVYVFALLLYLLGKGWDYHVLYNLFAVNNFFELRKIVIPWSWSLSVEIQFYLICPFIILWATTTKRFWGLFTLMFITPIIWTSYFYFANDKLTSGTVLDILVENHEPTIVYYMQYLYVVPPARLAAFALGLAAAWLWTHKQNQLSEFFTAHSGLKTALISGAFLACLAITSIDMYQPLADKSAAGYFLYQANMLIGRPLFTLMVAVILLLSLLRSGFSHRLLSHAVWYPIARVSYSMYLFHPIFLFAAIALLFGTDGILSINLGQLFSLYLIGVGFSFLFGIFTYYSIERWFIEGRFETWFRFKRKEKLAQS